MRTTSLFRLCLLVVVVVAAQVARAEESKALVSGDYVRVRAEPHTNSPQRGFLYKNMPVEIKAKTYYKEAIGDDTYFWYEVKSGELRGWVFGKFLSFDVANWNVDTYDAPSDMQWLYRRFGENTWYYDQKMNMKSFSMDEYRNLMRAAENGNEQAWLALRATILKHLVTHPDDADYAYLKKRLHSEGFLLKVINQPYAYNDPQFFNYIPYSRDLFAAALRNSHQFVRSMPSAYWNDKEIVLLVVNGPYGCDPSYSQSIPRGLAADADVKSALARCKSVR